MEPIQWHIGCSGFYYKEWKGLFYPQKLPQRKWFDFYALHFNSLEINNTFYRFPEPKLFDNWYQKAPPGFTFSVKVPQVITHLQRFSNTETLLHNFYNMALDGLKEKLGPVLFQLPPSIRYNEGWLQSIIKQMDTHFHNVVEFRHVSWWRQEVFTALKMAKIIFCGVSFPGLPDTPITDLPNAYYRLHGVPNLYYSRYEESFVQQLVRDLTNTKTNGAYIYFNNTASGAAIENAKFFQSLINLKT